MTDLSDAAERLLALRLRVPTPLEAIRERGEMRNRRRLRARAVGAAVAVVVVVAAGAVAAARISGTKTEVSVGTDVPGLTVTPTGGEVAAVSDGRLEIVEASTGRVVRSFDVGDGHRLEGEVGVNPSGSTAYVARVSTGCESDIVSVGLSTGVVATVVEDASSPAVSPDGTRLAYVAVGRVAGGCSLDAVKVRDLSTAASRSWDLHPGLSVDQVESLSWSPDGTRLALGEIGTGSGVEVLDVGGGVSATNPENVKAVPVRPGGARPYYGNPVYLPDETLAVVATPSPCPNVPAGDDCTPSPVQGVRSAIVIVDPTTGSARTVISSRQQITGVTADPSGRALLALADGNLYRVDFSRLILLERHIDGVAWLPRPSGPQRATAAQVEAFVASMGGQTPQYSATWSATVRTPHGPVHLTIASAAGADHRSFYRLPVTAGFDVPLPPGLRVTPGSTYAFYPTSSGFVSCDRPDSGAATWSCVSWPTVGVVGMSTSFELQSPYPPYTLPDAVSNALYSYGYQGGGQPVPAHTTPAFLYNSTVAGQPARCLAIGVVDHPVGHACIDRHGLIVSYAFPAKNSISSFYLRLSLLTYHPDPPASLFVPPASVKRPAHE